MQNLETKTIFQWKKKIKDLEQTNIYIYSKMQRQKAKSKGENSKVEKHSQQL